MKPIYTLDLNNTQDKCGPISTTQIVNFIHQEGTRDVDTILSGITLIPLTGLLQSTEGLQWDARLVFTQEANFSENIAPVLGNILLHSNWRGVVMVAPQKGQAFVYMTEAQNRANKAPKQQLVEDTKETVAPTPIQPSPEEVTEVVEAIADPTPVTTLTTELGEVAETPQTDRKPPLRRPVKPVDKDEAYEKALSEMS